MRKFGSAFVMTPGFSVIPGCRQRHGELDDLDRSSISAFHDIQGRDIMRRGKNP